MKKIILFSLIAAALVLSACSSSQKRVDNDTAAVDDKVFSRDYLMRDLDNGLRVIIVPTEYPDVVSIQMPVQTGSRNEVEPGKSGFAHFFEHMMFRGTKNYTQDEYGAILKNAGADQNAYTTDDYTNYHVTINKNDLETLLMLEADRFQNLQYKEAEFRTEALAVKGEYLKNSANPFSKMFEVIRKTAFKDHTYRHTTMGFIEDIEDMPNQLEYSYTFFDRWYRPEKTAVIVVGDVEAEATFELVNKYFGSWERGDYSVDIPVEPPPSGQNYEHIKWASPTSPILAIAFRGPGVVDQLQDKMATDMMGEIYFGSNSDIYQDLVVSRQLADALFFYAPDSKDPGLIYLAARLTSADNFAEVRDQLIKTVVEARTEMPDQKQLDDLKSATRYGFTNNLDNSEAIGDMLASVVHFNRDPEFINQQFAALNAVTPADVKAAANRFLIDDGRITVTLAEAESVAGFPSEYMLADKVAAANAAPQQHFATADLSNDSDIVDINLLFNTGSAQDPEGKKGLAQLTSALLTDGGSQNKTYQEIQKAMYPMAAYFYAQVDKEMISMSGRVHKDKVSEYLDLILDSLLNPGFRDEDFKRLKTQQINSIQTDLKANNDEELGKEVLYEKLYAGHAYGSLNLGHVKDLESITIDDIKAFYQQQLVQANLTVGLTGGISAEAKQHLFDRIARELSKGEKVKAIDTNIAMPSARQVTIVEKETLPTAVSFGYPIPVNRSHPDWVALWLVRSYLGEHRNSNSFLYQRIREARGMNYGDYAYIEYFPRGMFRTQPNANLGRSSQIFQVWLRPLRNNQDAHFATRVAMYEVENLIKNGMTQEQFEATKAFLSKYAGLLLKGQDRVLGYHMDSLYYGNPNFVDLVKNGLDKLTLEQVNAVIRKHIQTDDLHFVFITKDAKDMRDRLVNGTQSPMEYNSEKPADLLAEDKVIESYPLKIKSDDVKIVPIDKVFQ
ncbi:insulinase family protein [Marinicella sp. W31]|uniref:insulinase family protein n=1 Tax=Marinicella sp. W31 TaxID=3023713 RepID=UPI0037567594